MARGSRQLAVVVVAAATLGMLAPPLARAQFSQIAGSQQPGQLVPVSSSFAGVTVFSEREAGPAGPGSDRYYLTALIQGQRVRLPVAPRSGVPFDVDLGPDRQGNVVAAYSRCAHEPDTVTVRERFGARVFSRPYPTWTAGRGCDLYRYDFAIGRELRIAGASTAGASEMLPSIWKGQVAFARVYERRQGHSGKLERDQLPYLYVRTLGDRSARSQRQPGSGRGTNGLPGPVRLDLYGRRLSFAWNTSTGLPARGEMAGTSEVRLDTVGAGHRVLSRARWGADRPYASFVGPQGYAGRIFYGYQRAKLRQGTDRSVASLLLRYDITSAKKDIRSGVSGLLIDTSTGSDGTTIATDPTRFSFTAVHARLQRAGKVDYGR